MNKGILILTMLSVASLQTITAQPRFGGFGSKVLTIKSQDQLDRLLASNKYVVAQFLDWNCPVCKKFKAEGTFAALAQDFSRVKFAEISTQDAPDLHQKYTIQGTPTFIFFDSAQPVETIRGRINKGSFANKINKVFGLRASSGLQIPT